IIAYIYVCFFFQAEDGIRDFHVTGVQTCALPIYKILTGRRKVFHTNRKYGGISGFPKRTESEYDTFGVGHSSTSISAALGMAIRSEERRVGKEGGDQASAGQCNEQVMACQTVGEV